MAYTRQSSPLKQTGRKRIPTPEAVPTEETVGTGPLFNEDGSDATVAAKEPQDELGEPQKIDFGGVPIIEDPNAGGVVGSEIEVTEESIREEKRFEFQGKLERKKIEAAESTAERDASGEIVYDEAGNMKQREVGTLESIDGSVRNMTDQILAFAPNSNVASNDFYETIFGKENIEKWVANEDVPDFWKAGLGEEAKVESLRDIELDEAGGKATKDVIGSFQKGDVGGVVAGAFNAVTSLGSSMILATATGGAYLPIDFYGRAYSAYNGAAAEAQGKSVEELIHEDEDNKLVPLIFGGVGAALEGLGLKGTSNAIINNLGKKAAKKAAAVLLAGSSEAVTEISQTITEKVNEELGATGNDLGAGAQRAADALFEQDTWEAGVQGFLGGAGFSSGGLVERAGFTKRQKDNKIKELRKAAGAMRSEGDQTKMEKQIAALAQLKKHQRAATDPQMKKIIKNQIKTLNSALRETGIKANKIVNKMTKAQVKETGTIKDLIKTKIKDLDVLKGKLADNTLTRKEYEVGVNGLNAEFEENKRKLDVIKQEAEQQPTRYQNGKPTKHEVDEGSKRQSEELQRVYEELGPGKGFEQIIATQTGTIANQVKRYNSIPVDLRIKTVEDFKQEVEIELFNLTKSYKPADNPGVPLGAYVNRLLPLRVAGIYKSAQKAVFEEEIDTQGKHQPIDAGPDIDDEFNIGIETVKGVFKLGLPTKIINEIETAVDEALVSPKLPKVSDKKFRTKFAGPIKSKFLKTIKSALFAPKDYSKWLEGNLEAAYNSIPLTRWEQNRSSADADFIGYDGERRPFSPAVAEEFKNFMLKPRVGENTGPKHADSVKNDRKKMLVESIAETLAAKAFKDVLASNNEVAKQFRANQMALNEELAGGMNSRLFDVATSTIAGGAGIMANMKRKGDVRLASSIDMDKLQESNEEGKDDFANHAEQLNTVLENNGVGKLYDSKNDNDFEEGRAWVKDVLTQYFPAEFFAGNIGRGFFQNAGSSAQKRGFFFKGKKHGDDVADVVAGSAFGGQDNDIKWDKAGRYEYGVKYKTAVAKAIKDGKDPQAAAAAVTAKIKKEFPAIQEMYEQNQKIQEFMFKQFEKMIADNPANARGIAAILKSAQNSQNHISRIAAPIKAVSDIVHEGVVEEHTMPQTAVAQFLLESAFKGQVEANYPFIKENFFQVILNETDDKKLKKVKWKFKGKAKTLNDNMPEGWRVTDSAWARYFNAGVNAIDGGINPNSITFLDNGKTVAEMYGTEVPSAIKAHRPGRTANAIQAALDNVTGGFAYASESEKKSAITKVGNALKIKDFHNKLNEMTKNAIGWVDGYSELSGNDLGDVIQYVLNKEGGTLKAQVNFKKLFEEKENDAAIESGAITEEEWAEAYERINLKYSEMSQAATVEATGDKKTQALEQETARLQEEANALQRELAATKMSNQEAIQGVAELLNAAWADDNIDFTSDFDSAMNDLTEEGGMSEQEADTFLRSVQGYKQGDFVYINRSAGPDTAIHEFSHIWNERIQETNPELWNYLKDTLKNSRFDNDLYQQQKERIEEGYNLEFESDAWWDEAIAGAVGDQSQYHSTQEGGWGAALEKYWNAVTKLLGFDPKTTNIRGMSVENLLETLVADVVSGKPGSVFAEFKDADSFAGLKAKKEARDGIKAKMKDNGGVLPAMKALKEAYRKTKNMAQAIEIAGKKLEGEMDMDAFRELVAKTTKEITLKPGGNQRALQVAKDNYISEVASAIIDAKVNAESNKLNDQFNQIIEEKSGIAKDHIVTKKEASKSKAKKAWFIPPSMEDFAGLLQLALPKGAAGVAAQKFFKENLIDPFGKADANYITAKTKLLAGLQTVFNNNGFTQKKLNEQLVDGVSNSEAIRYVLADKAGHEVDISDAQLQKIKDLVKGNPELDALGMNIDRLMDGRYANPNWINGTLESDIDAYAAKDLRNDSMAKFNELKNSIFTPENLNKYELIAGKDAREALEGSLTRMTTGQNRGALDKETSAIVEFISGAVAVVMAINVKSGALQLMSVVNFINLPDNNALQFAKAMGTAGYWNQFKEIFTSDYLKARRGSNATDVLLNDLSTTQLKKGGLRGLQQTMLQKGFIITQYADSMAIAWGGAAYVMNRTKALMKREGLTKEQASAQAMLEMQASVEESQQSSRGDKVSQAQSSTLGRLLFAFANTPLQYSRISKKAYQDLRDGRGSTRKNFGKMAFYGAVQGVLFQSIQSALWRLWDDEEDEKDKKKLLSKSIYKFADSFHASFGLAGKAIASIGGAVYDYIQKRDPDSAALALLNVVPGISSKLGDAKSVAYGAIGAEKAAKKGDTKGVGEGLWQSFLGVSSLVNVPIKQFQKLFNHIEDTFKEDRTVMGRILSAIGFSRYSLGIAGKKKETKDPFDIDFGFDSSEFDALDEKFDAIDDKFDNLFDDPLKRGTTGEANKDGTISVDPNLSGEERELTIKHEEKHMAEMDAGTLAYDDTRITYKGEDYPRKNGRVKFNGRWLKEGAKQFPWEAAAYTAEKKKTPLARKRTIRDLY